MKGKPMKKNEKIIENSKFKDMSRVKFNKLIKTIEQPQEPTVDKLDGKYLFLSIENLGIKKMTNEEW